MAKPLPTTKKPFRFGIASPEGLMGPTFTLKPNKKGDAYLSCREISGEKLSLHQSGVSRWAAEGEKRPALNRATLLELAPEMFVTVARMIFTSESQEWRARDAKLPHDFLAIPPPERGSVVLAALSFTPRHPSLSPKTATSVNRAVMELASNRFLTLSCETVSLEAIGAAIPQVFTPHPTSEFTERVIPSITAEISDVVTMFNTTLNTFVFWCHQDVPNERLGSWRSESPMQRQLEECRRLATQGLIPVGSSDFENAWNAHQARIGKPSLLEQINSGMIDTVRRQWWFGKNSG